MKQNGRQLRKQQTRKSNANEYWICKKKTAKRDFMDKKFGNGAEVKKNADELNVRSVFIRPRAVN